MPTENERTSLPGVGLLLQTPGFFVVRSDMQPYALVADDDALIRMTAADILEKAGFRVLQAEHTTAALKALEQHADEVHLLFTDVQMPPDALDGFHLARECARRWPHIGILVASGMMEPGPSDLPNGATFIRKPFSGEVVYARVNELLPDGRKPEPLKLLKP